MMNKRDKLEYALDLIDEFRSVKYIPKQIQESEDNLSTLLSALFAKVEKKVLEEFGINGVTGEPIKISIILSSFDDAIEEYSGIIAENTTEMIEYGKDKILKDLKQKGVVVTDDMVIQSFQEQVFQVSNDTMARLSGDVSDTLLRGYDEGLGTKETAKLVKEVFARMKDYEALRIARTEINSAQNYGAVQTMEKFGVQYYQWISATDSRTRDSHTNMNGQIAKAGELFSNGLRYAGDKSGRIEEWINCRCRVVPYQLPEGKTAPLGKTWFYESDLQ